MWEYAYKHIFSLHEKETQLSINLNILIIQML